MKKDLTTSPHGGVGWTRLTIQGVWTAGLGSHSGGADRWTRLTIQGVRAAGLGSPFGGGRARPPPPAPAQHLHEPSSASHNPGGRHHHPPFTAEATWVPNCVAGPGPLPGWFHCETGGAGATSSLGPPWGGRAETLPFATLRLYTRRSPPRPGRLPGEGAETCHPRPDPYACLNPRGRGRAGQGPGESPIP